MIAKCRYGLVLVLLILAGCSSLPLNQYQNWQPHYTNTPQHTNTPLHTYTAAKAEQNSLWQVILDGYQLQAYRHHPRVTYYINYYQSRRKIINIILQRAKPFLYPIVKQIEAKHMPTELALLPIVERGFNLTARSSAGAVGLWQLMPATAARFDVTHKTDWYHGRQSLAQSTAAALTYLQFLHDKFDGNWLLAIAAYNSGEGSVSRAIKRNLRQGKPTDVWSLPLPTETKDYVPRLLALSIIMKNPSRYGTIRPNIPNQPLIATVILPRQINLRRAAQYAGISLKRLQSLNPAYTRMLTPPSSSGTYHLTLPIDHVAQFEAKLASTAESSHLKFIEYTVKKGDTLNHIARRYRTTAAHLVQLNRLKGNTIYIDQTLVVPTQRHQTYIVQRGDSLTSIATRFNVSVIDLQRWNNIKQRNLIHTGQKLVIK